MVHYCRHIGGDLGVAVVHLLTPKTVEATAEDPTERVFDYADMLTDEEEQSLREYSRV